MKKRGQKTFFAHAHSTNVGETPMIIGVSGKGRRNTQHSHFGGRLSILMHPWADSNAVTRCLMYSSNTLLTERPSYAAIKRNFWKFCRFTRNV